jgi:hypothetical protein
MKFKVQRTTIQEFKISTLDLDIANEEVENTDLADLKEKVLEILKEDMDANEGEIKLDKLEILN